jgi:hypothetical protein
LQVVVPPELFDEVEQEYAPADHPVFELVPPAFNERAEALYDFIGRPVVQSDTFWDVYRHLLQQFHVEQHALHVAPILMAHNDIIQALALEKEMALLPNLKELRNGADVVGPPQSKYIGGMVNNPPVTGLRPGLDLEPEEEGIDDDSHGGIAEPQYAEFTSDEGDDDEDVDVEDDEGF